MPKSISIAGSRRVNRRLFTSSETKGKAMEDQSPKSARSWLVVFTAGAFFFYSFIQMTLFTTQAMKQHFQEQLSLEDMAAFGNFAVTFLLGTVVFLIPAGVLLDKVSVKKLILATLGLVILCAFGLAFTTNVYVAGMLRFVAGVAHCVAFMAPFRLAPRWFASERLALAAGLLVTFAVFGGWVSGPPMLACIEVIGADMTLLLNGALGVGIFVLAALLVKDFPEGKAVATSGSEALPLATGLSIAAANKQNWLAGGYTGLLNLAVLLLAALWGTDYLAMMYPELSEGTVTGIIGMIMIGTMIGSPLCGLISDKLKSRKRSMLGGAVLSLAVMLAIMFVPNPGAVGLYALFLLLGMITAAQSIGYPVIAEANEDKVLGTANGLAAVVIMGMGAIGQQLFPQLVTALGGATKEAYGQAIWVMPIAFIGAIVCAVLLDETFKRES